MESTLQVMALLSSSPLQAVAWFLCVVVGLAYVTIGLGTIAYYRRRARERAGRRFFRHQPLGRRLLRIGRLQVSWGAYRGV